MKLYMTNLIARCKSRLGITEVPAEIEVIDVAEFHPKPDGMSKHTRVALTNLYQRMRTAELATLRAINDRIIYRAATVFFAVLLIITAANSILAQNRASSYYSQLTATQAQLENKDSQINILASKYNALDTLYKNSQSKLASTETQVETMNKLVAGLNNQIAALHTANAEKQKQIATLLKSSIEATASHNEKVAALGESYKQVLIEKRIAELQTAKAIEAQKSLNTYLVHLRNEVSDKVRVVIPTHIEVPGLHVVTTEVKTIKASIFDALPSMQDVNDAFNGVNDYAHSTWTFVSNGADSAYQTLKFW